MASVIFRWRRWGLPAALLLCCLAGGSAAADDAAAAGAQQKIEAAYLYKFGAYVTWPDSAFNGPNSPLVIGVVGADTLAGELQTLVDGRSIGGRGVVVRRLQAGAPVSGVNILFVGTGSDAAIGSVRSQPILVVAEGDDGLQRGAMVSFVLVDDRVRFDVAMEPVQKSGLKLSSQLLSVAHSVSGMQP